MDRNFARALTLVLKSEGGWSDNAADPGGATMKGVTLDTFRRYVKPSGTKADLRAITQAQIETVYRRQFWDAVHGAELPDGVDYAAFDFAANSGPDRAARYLQTVVGAKADGRLGPESFKAINAKPAGVIIDSYCDSRLAFMKRAKNTKTGKLLWPTFGKGWTSRMIDVRRDALLMSAQAVITPKPSIPAAPGPEQAPIVAESWIPAKPAVILVTDDPPAVTTAEPNTLTPAAEVVEKNPFWRVLFAIVAAIFKRK